MINWVSLFAVIGSILFFYFCLFESVSFYGVELSMIAPAVFFYSAVYSFGKAYLKKGDLVKSSFLGCYYFVFGNIFYIWAKPMDSDGD